MTRPPHTFPSPYGGFERDERELELLAAYALGAIDPGEERELEQVLSRFDAKEIERFELAAAAAMIAGAGDPAGPLPVGVRSGLLRLAQEWASGGSAPGDEGVPASSARAGAPGEGRRALGAAGWLAAFAGLTLAAIVWTPLGMGIRANMPARAKGRPVSGAPGLNQTELGALRRELLDDPGDATIATWTPTETPDPSAVGASGDVVWSTKRQTGVIRIAGLTPNDPSVSQYQLWIFDEGRMYPVDGGVFDVPGSGDVLVAVDAKLPVRKPTMFAVTVERPGGVVVSDRSRVALLGAFLKSVSGAGERAPGRRPG